MKFLSNVYLFISSVFSTCCIGVLSMHLYGGENGGVNHLHDWNILV
ncbi:hypothetical protein [Methanobrevibacter millerae]|nr:hypothetical protein [Methanobrevibacter millerae]